MQLFYHKDLTQIKQTLTFDHVESRHIIKVLRKQVGDTLLIANGKGLLVEGKIITSNTKKCVVTATDVLKSYDNKPYKINIGIAPTKNIDRFEWFLEKSTEIGVDSITPLLCHNSERKILKLERLNKIIISAMKQSLHLKLPVLNPLTKFGDFIQTPFDGQQFIAHCTDNHKKHLFENLIPKTNQQILIGPEGDFSQLEIKTALELGYTPVSLGKSRLRTETAGVVATQTIALKNDIQ